jgi:hypothetical protein
MLLIGGTADRTWQEGAVGSADVLEIAGADHALQIDGDPLASLDALRLVVERVGAFLAALERTTRPSAA